MKAKWKELLHPVNIILGFILFCTLIAAAWMPTFIAEKYKVNTFDLEATAKLGPVGDLYGGSTTSLLAFASVIIVSMTFGISSRASDKLKREAQDEKFLERFNREMPTLHLNVTSYEKVLGTSIIQFNVEDIKASHGTSNWAVNYRDSYSKLDIFFGRLEENIKHMIGKIDWVVITEIEEKLEKYYPVVSKNRTEMDDLVQVDREIKSFMDSDMVAPERLIKRMQDKYRVIHQQYYDDLSNAFELLLVLQNYKKKLEKRHDTIRKSNPEL
ncbi:hypothetical protein ACP26L_36010 (plasmid) [Paenibacillus sp. S-38]|uniref:hypothetical protein n=1 Tax=Paenibacillus sp. S-38 TaxID=3416710 RepID=UPI003CF0D0FF